LNKVSIIFYNSLTKKEEEFKPIQKGKVGLYSCGPTVYNFAHIGNLRTLIFEDILQRALTVNGFEVKHVRNLTDVDDKTIRDSQKNKMSLKDFTEKFTVEYFKDSDALNVERAEVYPKATEHISEMIVMIEYLLDHGFAYKSDDGIYFEIKKFAGYGELAHLDLQGLQAGASGRNLKDEYEKENIADFALWKFWDESDGEVKWEAPFGAGRPGWHIECSAMSTKHLGNTFDIHTGGIDLLFPHHEDEVAQSKSCSGQSPVNFWLHAEHLLVGNKKMSKSLGNFYTLRDVIDRGFDPLAFRYLCLQAHYRSKLNFTWEALEGAQNALQKLYTIARAFITSPFQAMPAGRQGEAGRGWDTKFLEAINHDLNAPQALAVMWKMLDDESCSLAEKARLLLDFDKIFGLNIENYLGKQREIPEDIQKLSLEREKARQDKDWLKSDELRDLILAKGFIVEDTPEGQRIR